MEEPEPQPTDEQQPEQHGEIPEAQSVQVVQDNAVHTLEHVDHYLRIGQESDASDIHLAVNVKPSWRRYGNLEAIWLQADALTAADTEKLAMGFLNDAQKKRLR